MADQAVVCAQERCEKNLSTSIQAPAASRRGAGTPNGTPTRRHLRGKTEFDSLNCFPAKKEDLPLPCISSITFSTGAGVCAFLRPGP